MPRPLGIIAGGGAMPRQVIDESRASGREIFVIALNGTTAPETVEDVAHEWLDIGAVGRAKATLSQAGCRELCFVGGLDRPALGELKPDFQGMKLLPRVMAAARSGDDAILSVVIEFFEEAGFEIVAAESLVSPLEAPEGLLGQHAPDTGDGDDIDKAIKMLQALGPFDVGQAAVVRGGQVLAIEAAEGTDEMLRRCMAFKTGDPGGILVKCPKPGQERRIDLPTIGPETVAAAAGAGLKGIAVAAGGALIVARDATVRDADAEGLFIIGVPVDSED